MSMGHGFNSPDALRKFALSAAAQLREGGREGAAGDLEDAANAACSSGWEWLGQLGVATSNILATFRLSEKLTEQLARIQTAARSSSPYG
jgi:hypothetical protein